MLLLLRNAACLSHTHHFWPSSIHTTPDISELLSILGWTQIAVIKRELILAPEIIMFHIFSFFHRFSHSGSYSSHMSSNKCWNSTKSTLTQSSASLLPERLSLSSSSAVTEKKSSGSCPQPLSSNLPASTQTAPTNQPVHSGESIGLSEWAVIGEWLVI